MTMTNHNTTTLDTETTNLAAIDRAFMELIEQRRRELDLSVTAFAEMLGYSRNFYESPLRGNTQPTTFLVGVLFSIWPDLGPSILAWLADRTRAIARAEKLDTIVQGFADRRSAMGVNSHTHLHERWERMFKISELETLLTTTPAPIAPLAEKTGGS